MGSIGPAQGRFLPIPATRPPLKRTSTELGIIAGISVDKVAAAEGWSRQGAEDPGAWLAGIAEKLQPGESVDARLEVTRSPAAIEAEVVGEDGGEAGSRPEVTAQAGREGE